MKKKSGTVLYILAFVILFGIFSYSGIRLWRYYSSADTAGDDYRDLSQLRGTVPTVPHDSPTVPTQPSGPSAPDDPTVPATTEPSPYIVIPHLETGKPVYLLPEFLELYRLNPDIVGWISIDDTRIDYPVVQRPDDKDYYLYRDFYGKSSQWGCIYVREECDVFRPSDNVVIYGHRMLDGAMFYDLMFYERRSYWESHPIIRFDPLLGRYEYEIVCVMKISASAGSDYSFHMFNDAADEAEFNEFWARCKEKALYDTGHELRYGDKLISLFTCEYSQANGRLVVVARRIDK